MRLAQNIGLEDLAGQHVRVAAKVGANPGLKIGSLVAGMVAGADTIDGMDLLRHGAFPATIGGIRAPSTLGSFLRAFDHGNVRQLAAVHRRVLVELAARTPLLPGADTVAFIDVDSVQRRVYGGTKQGAAFGHAKIASKSLLVRGLNVLAATISTPLAAPVVAAARLRGGNAGSARGAATLVAEAITTARQAGATGLIVVRADSAYYSGAFVAACRRNGARFSVTVRMDPKVRRAIGSIPDQAWTAIKYPNAIYDEKSGEWISDAEIAKVPYTAFASKRAHRTDGELIVRRVRRLNPNGRPAGAGRAVRHLPVSRGVHRQPVHADTGRVRPPRPRGRRAGLRGPDRRTVGAPALGGVQRQRRLGPTRSHRARPDPRPRRAGLDPARPRPRRDDPGRTRPGRRPPRPQRTGQHHLAPTPELALAGRLAQRVRRHPPGTTGRGRLRLTARPHGHDRRQRVDTPDETPAGPACPNAEIPH